MSKEEAQKLLERIQRDMPHIQAKVTPKRHYGVVYGVHILNKALNRCFWLERDELWDEIHVMWKSS